MSTKQDIEKWNQGMALGIEGKYEEAERVFLSMEEHSARICFCMASCAIKQGKMYYAGKVRPLLTHSAGVLVRGPSPHRSTPHQHNTPPPHSSRRLPLI